VLQLACLIVSAAQTGKYRQNTYATVVATSGTLMVLLGIEKSPSGLLTQMLLPTRVSRLLKHAGQHESCTIEAGCTYEQVLFMAEFQDKSCAHVAPELLLMLTQVSLALTVYVEHDVPDCLGRITGGFLAFATAAVKTTCDTK
jgi:hypothetical protein